MKRANLEHIIRAATTIADDQELVVIGSQSVLGQFPDAPAELCVSNEADVYPRNHPERWELIDGSIGELSPFHETFGYYAQGVEPGTAVLPSGWQSRLIAIRGPATRDATGWCLEIHDLLVSKYLANREKDRRFARAAIRHRMVERETLGARLRETELESVVRERLESLIALDFVAALGS
jgi:hypothetical protein